MKHWKKGNNEVAVLLSSGRSLLATQSSHPHREVDTVAVLVLGTGELRPGAGGGVGPAMLTDSPDPCDSKAPFFLPRLLSFYA